ncbi:MAG: hypothetical protein EOO39_22355 [Cytophagaceae bacterium]|nr:MAG: hypothetical protein EOO39_22355 [Cytophagaceae bacterium]
MTNGGKVRMVLKANSNAPVNWLNTTRNSPNSNILGGGSGMQSFSEGSCPNSVPAWGFCEVSRGYWAYVQDYEISPYQPSGTYTWKMGVKNAAELTSKEVETSIKVNNSNFSASKPVITELNITPDAGLGSGAGGSVLVEILAQSEIPVNWLTRTLNSPTSNVFGGGSGQTFISCQTASPKPALCGSNAAGYYYFSFSDKFTAWSENGTYTYSGFSVQNASNISSDDFPQARTFVIAGNPVATTPNISSGQIYKVANYGDDPLTTGSLITGSCLVNTAQGSSLTVALDLAVDSSNAPVDWLTWSFTGPSSNLEGGGSGTNSFDLGSGNFRVVHYNTIASPNFAPQGSYYYDQLSVKNAGNKSSNVFGGVGLNFVMKASCP